MKKIAVPFLLVLLVVAGIWAFAVEPPADKEVLTFETKMGTVTFPHKVHAAKVGDCVSCHHTLEGDEMPVACSTCHDAKMEKDGAPKLKDAVHNTCWNCHKAKTEAGEKTGPVQKDCKGCHVKA